jgi:hypothetical protein
MCGPMLQAVAMELINKVQRRKINDYIDLID